MTLYFSGQVLPVGGMRLSRCSSMKLYYPATLGNFASGKKAIKNRITLGLVRLTMNAC